MKQYKVIVKEADGTPKGHFMKFHVRDLIKFTQFLSTKHPDWKWFNVFDDEGKQIANYTINSPPTSRRVS